MNGANNRRAQHARASTGLRGLLLAIILGAGSASAPGAEVRVAVAANFLSTLRALEPAFSEATGHHIAATAGSTGLLYAQIRNGAPFDVFLSADQERPRLLAADGFGVPEALFTYAIGQLVLWSADPQRVGAATLAGLADEQYRWLAMAEPATAPYGAAAREALQNLGLWDAVQPRMVKGQNVAQTFAMVATGNAELGFVSLAQALAYEAPGSYALVAAELHAPIRQDAVLLARAADDAAAIAFVEFLRSSAAAAIIERGGYLVPSTHM